MIPEPIRPLVFVVDDDADTRDLYRMILESVGYRVQDASGVSEAATRLKTLVPSVVLTDWRLPDGDGLAVCETLRGLRATRQVPIVAITGISLDDVQASQARERGCVGLMEKPVEPDAILRAVNHALVVGIQRRLRKAAECTRRYSSVARRSGGADPAISRSDAAALLSRVVARSTQPLTLLLADNAAHYVAADGNSRDLTGYEPGELTALTVWDLTLPPDAAASQNLWNQFIESGMQEGRYTLRRRDGGAIEAHYCAIANIAPGLHVSAIAGTVAMPESLAARELSTPSA